MSETRPCRGKQQPIREWESCLGWPSPGPAQRDTWPGLEWHWKMSSQNQNLNSRLFKSLTLILNCRVLSEKVFDERAIVARLWNCQDKRLSPPAECCGAVCDAALWRSGGVSQTRRSDSTAGSQSARSHVSTAPTQHPAHLSNKIKYFHKLFSFENFFWTNAWLPLKNFLLPELKIIENQV